MLEPGEHILESGSVEDDICVDEDHEVVRKMWDSLIEGVCLSGVYLMCDNGEGVVFLHFLDFLEGVVGTFIVDDRKIDEIMVVGHVDTFDRFCDGTRVIKAGYHKGKFRLLCHGNLLAFIKSSDHKNCRYKQSVENQGYRRYQIRRSHTISLK